MSDPAQDAVNGLLLAGDESRVVQFAAAAGIRPVEVVSNYGRSGKLWAGAGWLDPKAARSMARTLQAWATRYEAREA